MLRSFLWALKDAARADRDRMCANLGGRKQEKRYREISLTCRANHCRQRAIAR
jgi:hypothetical protein